MCFKRKDWLCLAFPFLITVVILGYFLIVSRKDLTLFINTVYPGHRISLGGTYSVKQLFVNPSVLFLPYRDIPYSNNCEVATYLHFAPFFFLLTPRILPYLKKHSQKDFIVGMTMTVILAFEVVFMLVGTPLWFAKLTLLSFCNRMGAIYHWTGTVYTVWGISVLLAYPEILNKWEKILWPVVYAAIYVLLIDERLRQHLQFQFHGVELGSLLIASSIIAFILVLLFTLWSKKEMLITMLVLLMVFSGAAVNPIERGIGAINNHPVSEAISRISQQEPEARWLCCDSVFYLSNYLIANGAKVLDATTFYPDPLKWKILDPQGEYTEFTNRYANQSVELIEGKTSVSLLHSDQIKLYLTPESLKKLEIRYLFSPVDYTKMLKRYDIRCEYITGQDGYGIYRLQYV